MSAVRHLPARNRVNRLDSQPEPDLQMPPRGSRFEQVTRSRQAQQQVLQLAMIAAIRLERETPRLREILPDSR
jgi:hypothetical protein